MFEGINEIENTPDLAVYQINKGNDTLTLSALKRYYEAYDEDGYNFVLKLESSNGSTYEKSVPIVEKSIGPRCIQRMAERLCVDESIEAKATKQFLNLVKGDSLLGKLSEAVKKEEEKNFGKQQIYTENMLNKFIELKDEKANGAQKPDNKLAKLRQRIAKKVGLENIKLPNSVKEVEGKVSKIFFEKKQEKSDR